MTTIDLMAAVDNALLKQSALLSACKGVSRKSGRKPLNIGIINVYEALAKSLTVADAAALLDCSPGFIYARLPVSEIKKHLGSKS